jgi:hypothetical protein
VGLAGGLGEVMEGRFGVAHVGCYTWERGWLQEFFDFGLGISDSGLVERIGLGF